MFWPETHSTNVNGPVPTGVLLKSMSVELGSMYIVSSWVSIGAYWWLSTNCTVASSTTSMWSTVVKFGRRGEPKSLSMILSNVYLTSSALKSLPL